MSEEKKDYLRNHEYFWDKIADFCTDFMNVTAREITFLPSVSIYHIKYKEVGRPMQVYFTPIVSGDSDTTNYFKIHPSRVKLPLPRKIIDYLKVCEESLSKRFDYNEWQERKDKGETYYKTYDYRCEMIAKEGVKSIQYYKRRSKEGTVRKKSAEEII